MKVLFWHFAGSVYSQGINIQNIQTTLKSKENTKKKKPQITQWEMDWELSKELQMKKIFTILNHIQKYQELLRWLHDGWVPWYWTAIQTAGWDMSPAVWPGCQPVRDSKNWLGRIYPWVQKFILLARTGEWVRDLTPSWTAISSGWLLVEGQSLYLRE